MRSIPHGFHQDYVATGDDDWAALEFTMLALIDASCLHLPPHAPLPRVANENIDGPKGISRTLEMIPQ
jgi:hypothetical protein